MKTITGSFPSSPTEPPIASSIGLPVIKPCIHSTGMGHLEMCPRYFMFADRFGLQSKGFESALETGTIYHMMIAELYQGYSLEEAFASADDYVAKILADLTERADGAGMLPGGVSLSSRLKEISEAFEKGQAMAAAMWSLYPLSPSFEVLAVEELLEIRLANYFTPIRIKCDLLIRNKENDECWIVDHKTTGMSPVVFAKRLPFSLQSKLYRLGVTLAYPDINLVGIKHSIIQKPTIKYCGKDANFQAYIDRVKNEFYTARLRDHPDNPPCLVSDLRFTEPLWNAEFYLKLSRADVACCLDPSLSAFYRTDGACLNYNRPCKFLDLCSTPPGLWADMISARFVQVDRDAPDPTTPQPKENQNEQ